MIYLYLYKVFGSYEVAECWPNRIWLKNWLHEYVISHATLNVDHKNYFLYKMIRLSAVQFNFTAWYSYRYYAILNNWYMTFLKVEERDETRSRKREKERNIKWSVKVKKRWKRETKEWKRKGKVW